MAFWGLEVKPGKMAPYVPPPESARLRVSNVCLDDSEVKGEATAVLSCKGEEDQRFCLCSLRAPARESTTLDLMFDGYTEFSVKGTAAVHLTGYFVPDDPEDDPELADQGALQQLLAQRYAQMERDGEDMDEDDDSDEDDDYDSDMEDMSEEDDSDEDLEAEPSVRIEELPNDDVQLASPIKQANGAASLKEQAKAAASHPAKPALKASAAGDAAAAANAAAGKSQAGGADTLPVPVVAKDEIALKKRRASEDPAEAAQKRAKSEVAAAPTAAAMPDSMAGLSKSQQKKLKKKLQNQGGPASSVAAAGAAPAAAAATLAQEVPTGKQKVRKFENGFQIEDLVMGQPDGPLAKPGQKVFVKYRGTLTSGKCFDETKGKSTFGFRLGTGEVIKGWDRGVAGMRVGDKRRLTIPPQMAYGAQGSPPDIPRNATLKFDVELVNVK
ncbi:hypothetical protein WJX74_006503 [Apatococcus lobatus]|uniref:FK506-binding protein n=1 Tax=Apatococcus lobatus TaxID=904363 RepID=A0AAW1RU50_9CHLO